MLFTYKFFAFVDKIINTLFQDWTTKLSVLLTPFIFIFMNLWGSRHYSLHIREEMELEILTAKSELVFSPDLTSKAHARSHYTSVPQHDLHPLFSYSTEASKPDTSNMPCPFRFQFDLTALWISEAKS
jgi:hypothetical protein